MQTYTNILMKFYLINAHDVHLHWHLYFPTLLAISQSETINFKNNWEVSRGIFLVLLHQYFRPGLQRALTNMFDYIHIIPWLISKFTFKVGTS